MISRRVQCETSAAPGGLPSHTLVGSYPLIYLCADGGVLCPACANGSEASDPENFERCWSVEAVDVYWEGSPLSCDHCNAEIESAYGDPDAEVK